MKKTIFALLMIVTFVAFTASAQTADKQSNSKGKTEQVVKTDNGTETAQTKLDNCPLKGTPDCPLVKNCPKKGTADCPYKAAASADNSATAQNLENCPLKGTPDCPLVKNCPKKGQPDCPYKSANATCSKSKKASCCAKK